MDKDAIVALDLDSGRVDTPPTVDGDRVAFGAADGWVYCLRAADGALVWRFRAAPDERQILAFGQLESPWPVHGAVLVSDGVAYVPAGRSTHLDGGIHVYALNPETGGLNSVPAVRQDILCPSTDFCGTCGFRERGARKRPGSRRGLAHRRREQLELEDRRAALAFGNVEADDARGDRLGLHFELLANGLAAVEGYWKGIRKSTTAHDHRGMCRRR